MLANYEIHLQPVKLSDDDIVEEVLEFDKVEVGFNQLGWLLLTDEHREMVACITPGSVKYVERRGEAEGAIINLAPEDVVTIN